MKPYSSNESCSPKRRKKGGSSKSTAVQTCFSYQSLARIARRYNEANPRDKITIHRSRDKLWNAIQDKMPQCNDERCWTRARYLSRKDHEELIEDFKPPIPQGQYDWLNTKDINQVMHSYERVFPRFVFLGTHPIDFQRIDDTFAPLNITALRQAGKDKAGLVLNLDESDEPGSHWVAVFLDLEKRVFEFFDSYGDSAPQEVKDFFHALDRRSKKGWSYRENKTSHQQKDSECGVYSIHFLVRRLSGVPFKRATEDVIRDAEMNQMRRHYFDPYAPYNNHI